MHNDSVRKHFFYLASYAGFSFEVLHIYDIEKRPAVLENAAAWLRETRRVYVRSRNKMGQDFMYQYMFCYYYVSVLHLFGYSVNGHFSIRVRVRVWYYFIFGTLSNSRKWRHWGNRLCVPPNAV